MWAWFLPSIPLLKEIREKIEDCSRGAGKVGGWGGILCTVVTGSLNSCLFAFQFSTSGVWESERGGVERSNKWDLRALKSDNLYWRSFSKMMIKHNGGLVDNWLFCVVCSLKICSSFGPVVPWDLLFLCCFPPINSALFDSNPHSFTDYNL